MRKLLLGCAVFILAVSFFGCANQPAEQELSFMSSYETKDVKAVMTSSNAKRENMVSCPDGYYSGDFKATFWKGGKIVKEFDLPDKLIAPSSFQLITNDIVAEVDEGASATPEVRMGDVFMLQEYGSCNGDMFSFYSNKGEIIPIEGTTDNKIFANKNNGVNISVDIHSPDIALEVIAYDNTVGKNIESRYYWSGREFIEE